ncbi:MAG TPA: STAS domain-containing protein [Pseudomonadota bacterium]|nr:STAS domain-containing protein [Pseudomonadota bacterium]
MPDKTSVTVPFERIQRVIDVLSMVSIGEYNSDLIQIPASDQADEFSVLEAALNIYNQELSAARAQNERYIAELEQSKRELQEQLSTIARQQLAINELSAPTVELWEEILLLPVIGTLDTQRAQEMTEKLLDRVKQSRSRCIIIDITGVEIVDTTTANSVLKMTRAARLLGAMCVLTGIRPEIARTMIQLGVELEGLRTLRTLKDGLRECFAYLRRAKEREKALREDQPGHGTSAGLSLLSSMQKSRAPAAAQGDAEAAPAAPPASRSFESPVSLQQVAAGLAPGGEGNGEPGSP